MTECVNPLTIEQQMEANFILSLLQSEFGGSTALGLGQDGIFVVLPTCTCAKCVEFKKLYQAKPNATILGAAKAYGDDKLCHQQTLEAKQAGVLLH